jgi:hypothetical protein
LIGYEAKVQISPVGKNPRGRFFLNFLEDYEVNRKFSCGLLIEGNFIVGIHARGDDVLD